MSNELTTRGASALITSTDDYYAALAQEAEGYRGGGGGPLFLKFNGNDGYYSYGADDIELVLGTQAAMDPKTLKRGFICWKEGKVQEEIMMSLAEGLPPAKHLLPDHGPYGVDDGWQEQKTIEFKTIEGDFLTLLFQANNKSKMNALEALMKDFARLYKNYPGQYPVIELDENEFETKPKDGGRKVRKHAPKFKIVGWMTEEELLALSEGDPADYQEGAETPALEDQSVDLADDQPEPEAEPAPEPEKRGGRRAAPATEATPRAPASRPAAAAQRAAPAPAAAAAAPAPAAATAAAPRGRRF